MNQEVMMRWTGENQIKMISRHCNFDLTGIYTGRDLFTGGATGTPMALLTSLEYRAQGRSHYCTTLQWFIPSSPLRVKAPFI